MGSWGGGEGQRSWIWDIFDNYCDSNTVFVMQKKVSRLIITKLAFNKSRNPVEISFKFLRYFHFHLWVFHCNKMKQFCKRTPRSGPQATLYHRLSLLNLCLYHQKQFVWSVEWRSLHADVRKTSGRTSQRGGTQIVLARCKIVGTYRVRGRYPKRLL